MTEKVGDKIYDTKYADLSSFFADLNKPLNLAIALLVLIFISFILLRKFSNKIVVILFIVLIYILIGAFFAPGMWGGQADFLYDPRNISQNMPKAWTLILLWPLTIIFRG
ncbi:MAG: hypothetical protein UU34_C0001G0099 [Candidatus Curtissbacteria bacterium GW2011_GWA1_41_11]|uniref:Uncharacterized protein n=1 Tax=Candidatus Curtissbacteria bacterium GW2011_GWA1_41_11 TaxID=1618409 RepID=A0A0G0XKC6_9BACT|nr:MAG: hypothetical protein UU34_C0001G0099 [Candidatus Curtissbacteria bacterium GW2011_GWA1_41_11]